MDLNKLTIGDKIIAGAGFLFFISLFLPWYGFDFGNDFVGSASVNQSGFDYFLFGIIPFLLIAAVITVIVLDRLVDTVNLPELPLTWGQAMVIASAVAAALVLLKLVIGDSVAFGAGDLDRKFGIFIALLAAAGVVAGAFLNMQADQGTAAPGGGSVPPQPF